MAEVLGPIPRPIRVLCLHGCNQTEAMFRQLMKNYIKLGEKQYNLKFHFIEAKYDHPDGGKTWYNKALDVTEIGSIKYDEELVNDTLNDIDELIKSYGISVLLGFSQGANVVDTYLSHRDHSRIKCAVIMSSYSLVDPEREEVDVPVLGVVSEEDEVVPHHLNPTDYVESRVLKHDKGHKLPTRNPQIREICIFMQKEGKVE